MAETLGKERVCLYTQGRAASMNIILHKGSHNFQHTKLVDLIIRPNADCILSRSHTKSSRDGG